MYIFMFILGAAVGMFCFALVTCGSRQKELQDAYEKGRSDERATIIEKIEGHYGVRMDQDSFLEKGKIGYDEC